MAHLSNDQLAALARSGALNHEIVAHLGRPMTDDEKATVDRARLAAKLKRAVAAQTRQSRGPISDREKHNRANQRDRLFPFRDPTPEEVTRRRDLECDPEEWLRWYMPERFPLPFGPVHKQIIRAAMRGMQSGTSVTVAAPRGFGKTAILWGMALFGVLTGRARFPVVIGWKQTAGAELLDQWLEALASNDRLAAGYPCVCDCFRESTASKRLQGLLREIDPEPVRAGCDVRKGRGTVLLPQTREPSTGRVYPQAALAGASMNGSIKGLNVGLLDGESLRPDIVMIDDPQDTATAESPTLVAKIIRRIDYGLRSLSGPQRRLTVMAAVTCVEPEDVSAHLLNRPGTESIRCGQVVTWPTGWADQDSATRAAWTRWNQARLDGLDAHDGGAKARECYLSNHAALTDGMTVSWRHRYHVGDADRASDPDALFAAMWDFFDLGEAAFMAERQNAPIKRGVTVYTLTPGVVLSRAQDRPAGVVPDWSQIVVAATDVNRSYALSTVVVAFGANQTAAVCWYGTHPMAVTDDMTEIEKRRLIYEALATHGKQLAALPCRPGSWVIDGGGSPEGCVIQLAFNAPQICGLQAACCFGRNWKTYKPTAKATYKVRAGEQWHNVSERRDRQWIVYHADYWREVAQRGWTGAPGGPGSCSLPTGHHAEFAQQVTREQLAGKDDVGGRTVWVWTTAPGPHDYGDCMHMAYMAASVAGIGTGGAVVAQRTRKRYSQSDLTGR